MHNSITHNGITHNSITLIGMAYAGKSTIGCELAKMLNKQYIDTDALIVQHYGMPLQNIINTYGANKFLQIEEEVISSIHIDNAVVATGGSVIYSIASLEKFKKCSHIYNISIPYDVFVSRMNNTGLNRGIILPDGITTYLELYNSRNLLYSRYITINGNQPIIDVVNDIIIQYYYT